MPLTDAGENGTNWPVYFALGAESYSSLGHVGKKREENSMGHFGQIRLWTSFESSPVSVNLGKNTFLIIMIIPALGAFNERYLFL